MFGENFELNEETLAVIEAIGAHMPGGFFIYKAEAPEELLYANHEVFDIFGCKDLEEFKELTGYTFKGMLHPDDYAAISDSIIEQIDHNDDNMDYVEYRIIRKDGSVRWVDDFGHFTETGNYGGIYYVFISDITEKHERLEQEVNKARDDAKKAEEENKRLIQEVENAAKLADLMGSVASLLTNMPAMSFSKDAKTGVYLACNQSFAEYAHKENPQGVIGLTDHEIFDPVTAAHFVEDDKKALAMDVPYIFFEDVPDAKGVMRNLQTTKMKFIDAGGRLCTLGMCVDVTEMTRIKSAEAEARIKQQELEEKIALQEKLLEQSQTLREALQTAEEASKAKSNFLSNMSHEIRTPITAILGMNELIRRETKDKNILDYSNSIAKAGTSLLGIINDILDFSKIEAGRVDLVNVDYELSEMLADLMNLTKFRADEKGLILSTEIDPELPSVLNGDELKIKQIITNLLSNAVKYTEKGSVVLTLKLGRIEGDTVTIDVAVKDTGIGIKEEEREKLFTAFDRLDLIRTRSIQGTGLGLAITSKMLENMGSSLHVESTYGVGSTFYFSLAQKIVESDKIGDVNPMSMLESELEPRADGEYFVAPEAHVLIVDDTPLNLQVIVGLLKRTRAQIDTAASGRACIDTFGEKDYDMVFLDYRMPEMDGIETLNKLYETYPDKAKATPIVCLTASAVAGDREKMLAAGFDDYLSKPVNITKMEDMMRKYISATKIRVETLETESDEEDEELLKLPPYIFEIDELEPESGIEYCGDAEDYMTAIEIYEASIKTKAADIEKKLAEGDIDAYVILVHSLKSTSRAIGANEMAELALHLEQAGKAGDIDEIKAMTPKFLERYRGLDALLVKLLEDAN